MAISFIDLQAQRRRLGPDLDRVILEAVAAGQWIMGPQVHELEKRLAAFAGVKHAITCANGTDALMILLRAWNIGPGDAVFVPAFTFAATAGAVCSINATPIFVDVDPETRNMDPADLERAIDEVIAAGELKPRVIMPVDLYGLEQHRQARSMRPTLASCCSRCGLLLHRELWWFVTHQLRYFPDLR